MPNRRRHASALATACGNSGPHDMQLDRQMVGSRPVNFRCALMQQLQNQLLGFFEVAGQKFALRAFKPQAERQRVVPSPVFVVEQVHAGR